MTDASYDEARITMQKQQQLQQQTRQKQEKATPERQDEKLAASKAVTTTTEQSEEEEWPLVCEFCGARYKKEHFFDRMFHIARVHKPNRHLINRPPSVKPVDCGICGKTYQDNLHLHKHYTISHPGWPCPIR